MNTDPILNAGQVTLVNLLGTSRGAQTTGSSPVAIVEANRPASPTLSPSDLEAQNAAVQRAVADSNAKLKIANINLEFQFNLGSNGSLRSVQLLDSSTQQVVIQYPSETMLAIRDQIDHMIEYTNRSAPAAGSLFSQSA